MYPLKHAYTQKDNMVQKCVSVCGCGYVWLCLWQWICRCTFHLRKWNLDKDAWIERIRFDDLVRVSVAHKEQRNGFCWAEQLLLVWSFLAQSCRNSVHYSLIGNQHHAGPNTYTSSSQLYSAVELVPLHRYNPLSLLLTHITFLSLIFFFFLYFT